MLVSGDVVSVPSGRWQLAVDKFTKGKEITTTPASASDAAILFSARMGSSPRWTLKPNNKGKSVAVAGERVE